MTRVFGWRHAPEAWAEIWEKAVSSVPASEEEGWLSELGEARRLYALRAPHVGWVESWRCKSSQHRKIVCLSPHVKKPLNSKRWIKVSYLNQFREFRVLDSLCLFHISVYYGYVTQQQQKRRVAHQNSPVSFTWHKTTAFKPYKSSLHTEKYG